jgi:hypothetical protein
MPASLFLASILIFGGLSGAHAGQVRESRKSEVLAYALALGGTALPVASGAWLANNHQPRLGFTLLSLGALAGPSLGQIYAASYSRSVGGVALRTLGGFFVLTGLIESFKGDFCAVENFDRVEDIRSCKDGNPAPHFTVAGFFLFGGTLFSLVETHYAVDRWNKSVFLSLSPTLARDADGPLRPGAMASLRF